jgi:hypothetical protein
MKSHFSLLSGFAVALLVGVLPASASTVTYDFGQLSGGTAPAGSPPWISAVFSDSGANTVQLTLNAANLVGTEYVSCWYFNFNPGLDPTSLSFTPTGSSGSFTSPSVQTGANGFKAGPDGKYDILLTFSSVGQFSGGDSITFTITGLSGLTATDFDQLSTQAGGSGSYSSAAHIQSIAPGDATAWINPTATTVLGNAQTAPAVPDGSVTIVLLGASLLAVEAMRRKMQVRSSAQ